MATTGIAGSVSELWRFPVKSMQGERLAHAEIRGPGLIGDRAFALIDVETGKVVTAKSVKLFPDLLRCQAVFVEPPKPDRALPPVRITLPDGTTAFNDSGNIDPVLSAYFRRSVTLAHAAPEDFTIDYYPPEVAAADPTNPQGPAVELKLGAAFYAQSNLESPVPPGSFFDLFPLSVLTLSTLKQLATLRPQSRFDPRRFRMNVIIDAHQDGFVENGWIGHTLAIGDTLRLSIALPDPRCVMTTLPQDDLPNDPGILAALAQHNNIQVGGEGEMPCAGVYAVVETPGIVRTGDRVVLL
jgi:uncharacterized protein YcbX